MTDLAARGLKPASVLAESRPHGTRIKYIGGCRCAPCRAANTRYECERLQARKRGEANGIVSADRARAHIAELQRQGVGRRALGAASDVGDTCLVEIIAGRKQQIRQNTERRILAVTDEMASDHALTSAAPTWRLIKQLLEEGYTRGFIAQRLGAETPALQIGKRRVLVKTAYRVQQLHRKLMS